MIRVTVKEDGKLLVECPPLDLIEIAVRTLRNGGGLVQEYAGQVTWVPAMELAAVMDYYPVIRP